MLIIDILFTANYNHKNFANIILKAVLLELKQIGLHEMKMKLSRWYQIGSWLRFLEIELRFFLIEYFRISFISCVEFISKDRIYNKKS